MATDLGLLTRHCSVSEGGLEPPRPCGHQPLKLARLPIPPLRRAVNWNAASGDRSARGPSHLRRGDGPGTERRPDYCPGSEGVVLLVDSGVRTAQSWANQSSASLRGVAVTPPIV